MNHVEMVKWIDGQLRMMRGTNTVWMHRLNSRSGPVDLGVVFDLGVVLREQKGDLDAVIEAIEKWRATGVDP